MFRKDRQANDYSNGSTADTEETEKVQAVATFKQMERLIGHDNNINRIAWSPDQKTLATSSYDRTIRLWHPDNWNQPRTLRGHNDWVSSVTWSPDGQMLASGSGDNQILLWNANTGQPIHTPLVGHHRTVFSVAWSPDGRVLASASGDRTIVLWNTETFKPITVFQGHGGAVFHASWSPDGSLLATASEDGTVRIWDAATGKVRRIFEGHSGAVYNVAWSKYGVLASVSADSTVRLWGRQNGVLEGHTDIITGVSFSADGKLLATKSMDGTVRLWRCDNWETVKIIDELASMSWTAGIAFHPRKSYLATLGDEDQAVRLWRFNADLVRDADAVVPSVRYTNAKVVLVGDSGVGKSSLAMTLRGKDFEPTESTHGRQVWRFDTQEFVLGRHVNEFREILLWDMAGQPSYRLIHQLHLNEVVVALVVFDQKSDTDPFAGVRHWDRALRHAHFLQGDERLPLKTFLVAGRMDRGGVGVNNARIDAIVKDLKFSGYFETSAKEGWNIADLNSAIRGAIDWDKLPRVSSTRLFQSIKNFLTRVREQGRETGQVLHTVDSLYDTFLSLPGSPMETEGLRAQFETCISLVESQGFIRHFSFSNLVLLQPELMDAYASSMIAFAKEEADGMGLLAEEMARTGRFRMPDDERVGDKNQEELLLIATIADLLRHEIALRDEDASGVVNLVFPSQSTRLYPNTPEPDARTSIFNFEGPVLNIYTTLAVRLWHTGLFVNREMYENAVFFITQDGGKCQLFLKQLEEGRGELMFFSDEGVSKDNIVRVDEYINAHLMRRALPNSVSRRKVFVCSHCGTPISEIQVKKRRELKKDFIVCNVCDNEVDIRYDDRVSPGRSLVRQAIVLKLDRKADTEREKQMAMSIVQGKLAKGEFDVFMCHNNRDKAAVAQICEQLKDYGVLPWIDLEEITPGERWQNRVQEQIDQSKVLAFFLGDNGIGPRQQQELEYADELGLRIIPVILPNTKVKPKPHFVLTGKSWVDFNKAMPIPIEHLVRGITGKKQIR